MLRLKVNPMESDIDTVKYLSDIGDSLARSILEDLEKSKNHTGLVQVERTVNKKGTTFIQKFWIRPDRFRTGDRVLQGAKNLNAYINREFEDRNKKMSKNPKEFDWANDVWDYFGLGSSGDMFPDWVETLDEDETEAIEDYTTYNYKVVNNYLRGKGELDDWDEMKAQRIIEPLEKAIDRFELKDDIVVHRKMSADVIKMFKVGEIWQDDAFVSTTPIKGSFVPHNHTNDDDEYDDTEPLKMIDMVIHVKAGRGVGAWVAPISKLEDENEFILNRGTKFKVKRISSNFEGGHQVELEVVGHDPKGLEDLHKSIKHSAYIKQSHMDKFTWSAQDIKKVS